jgi:hypothetical protein
MPVAVIAMACENAGRELDRHMSERDPEAATPAGESAILSARQVTPPSDSFVCGTWPAERGTLGVEEGLLNRVRGE